MKKKEVVKGGEGVSGLVIWDTRKRFWTVWIFDREDDGVKIAIRFTAPEKNQQTLSRRLWHFTSVPAGSGTSKYARVYDGILEAMKRLNPSFLTPAERFRRDYPEARSILWD